jgi:2-hydroxychromene-2-carboxylate isomerase
LTRTIDYFFSIGSPWSFIGLDTFIELVRKNGLEIRPYLTTVVEENGGILARNRPEPRRAYGTRELRRWAKVRGKELLLDNRPALSDPAPAALSVIALYLEGGDWVGLTRALQEAFWSRGQDIGKSHVREAIADAAGFDGIHLLEREGDRDVTEKWIMDRDYAARRGVFGFPTYGYEGEIYWGQDNLPFLERHVSGERP